MCKEAYEDLKRFQRDKAMNNAIYEKLDSFSGNFTEIKA
jgi:hypothetical protein